MTERDERLYLTDIVEAIDRILRYTAPGRDAFFADRMVQDSVIRNLEILGEAAKAISETTRAAHTRTRWGEGRSGTSTTTTAGSSRTRTPSGRRSRTPTTSPPGRRW